MRSMDERAVKEKYADKAVEIDLLPQVQIAAKNAAGLIKSAFLKTLKLEPAELRRFVAVLEQSSSSALDAIRAAGITSSLFSMPVLLPAQSVSDSIKRLTRITLLLHPDKADKDKETEAEKIYKEVRNIIENLNATAAGGGAGQSAETVGADEDLKNMFKAVATVEALKDRLPLQDGAAATPIGRIVRDNLPNEEEVAAVAVNVEKAYQSRSNSPIADLSRFCNRAFSSGLGKHRPWTSTESNSWFRKVLLDVRTTPAYLQDAAARSVLRVLVSTFLGTTSTQWKAVAVQVATLVRTDDVYLRRRFGAALNAAAHMDITGMGMVGFAAAEKSQHIIRQAKAIAAVATLYNAAWDVLRVLMVNSDARMDAFVKGLDINSGAFSSRTDVDAAVQLLLNGAVASHSVSVSFLGRFRNPSVMREVDAIRKRAANDVSRVLELVPLSASEQYEAQETAMIAALSRSRQLGAAYVSAVLRATRFRHVPMPASEEVVNGVLHVVTLSETALWTAARRRVEDSAAAAAEDADLIARFTTNTSLLNRLTPHHACAVTALLNPAVRLPYDFLESLTTVGPYPFKSSDDDSGVKEAFRVLMAFIRSPGAAAAPVGVAETFAPYKWADQPPLLDEKELQVNSDTRQGYLNIQRAEPLMLHTSFVPLPDIYAYFPVCMAAATAAERAHSELLEGSGGGGGGGGGGGAEKEDLRSLEYFCSGDAALTEEEKATVEELRARIAARDDAIAAAAAAAFDRSIGDDSVVGVRGVKALLVRHSVLEKVQRGVATLVLWDAALAGVQTGRVTADARVVRAALMAVDKAAKALWLALEAMEYRLDSKSWLFARRFVTEYMTRVEQEPISRSCGTAMRRKVMAVLLRDAETPHDMRRQMTALIRGNLFQSQLHLLGKDGANASADLVALYQVAYGQEQGQEALRAVAESASRTFAEAARDWNVTADAIQRAFSGNPFSLRAWFSRKQGPWTPESDANVLYNTLIAVGHVVTEAQERARTELLVKTRQLALSLYGDALKDRMINDFPAAPADVAKITQRCQPADSGRCVDMTGAAPLRSDADGMRDMLRNPAFRAKRSLFPIRGITAGAAAFPTTAKQLEQQRARWREEDVLQSLGSRGGGDGDDDSDDDVGQRMDEDAPALLFPSEAERAMYALQKKRMESGGLAAAPAGLYAIGATKPDLRRAEFTGALYVFVDAVLRALAGWQNDRATEDSEIARAEAVIGIAVQAFFERADAAVAAGATQAIFFQQWKTVAESIDAFQKAALAGIETKNAAATSHIGAVQLETLITHMTAVLDANDHVLDAAYKQFMEYDDGSGGQLLSLSSFSQEVSRLRNVEPKRGDHASSLSRDREARRSHKLRGREGKAQRRATEEEGARRQIKSAFAPRLGRPARESVTDAAMAELEGGFESLSTRQRRLTELDLLKPEGERRAAVAHQTRMSERIEPLRLQLLALLRDVDRADREVGRVDSRRRSSVEERRSALDQYWQARRKATLAERDLETAVSNYHAAVSQVREVDEKIARVRKALDARRRF